jgi:hypothetical protein
MFSDEWDGEYGTNEHDPWNANAIKDTTNKTIISTWDDFIL